MIRYDVCVSDTKRQVEGIENTHLFNNGWKNIHILPALRHSDLLTSGGHCSMARQGEDF